MRVWGLSIGCLFFLIAASLIVYAQGAAALNPERSKISSSQWRYYFGERATGDSAYQAVVKERSSRTVLHLHKCTGTTLELSDDNLTNFHKETKRKSLERNSWLRYGSPLVSYPLLLKEGLGWYFTIDIAEIGSIPLFSGKSFYICNGQSDKLNNCLEFAISGMKEAAENLCGRKF